MAAPQARQRDAERTRSEILDVATREFAEHGLAGARVDEIAARTRTTKRMIYYYFGGKEQLYIAVLERAYARIRAVEREVDVDHLDPLDAIRRLAELTFDHHDSHPEFIRLVSIENIHHAEHMAQVQAARQPQQPGHRADRDDPRARPRGAGLPPRRRPDRRPHADQLLLRVPRRQPPHVRTLFDRDLTDPERRDHYRRMLGDMVVDYLSATA